jgi:alpha-galactosidase
VEYVAQDGSQAVVFAYLHSQDYGLAQSLVRLKGLDPKAKYRVSPLDAEKYSGDEVVLGAVLMGRGVEVKLAGDYDSTAVVLERVP